jgi:PEGA domain
MSACVRKRMTIRTNPPGAMVYVDKQPIGLTPVSSNFTYYGTRNIEIIRDGFRTERFLRKFSPVWYEIPPLDFVSETLWPFELRDERIIDVQLTQEPVVSDEALIASGEQLKLQAGQGIAVSPPPTVGPISPIVTNPMGDRGVLIQP